MSRLSDKVAIVPGAYKGHEFPYYGVLMALYCLSCFHNFRKPKDRSKR
jgi:hypothetical protein